MTSLAGKVALVTGGTSGIGAATAQELLQAGARVVVSARFRADCDSFVQAAIERKEIDFLAADVTSERKVRSLVGSVVDAYGRLDLALNSAGYEGELHAIQDYPSQDLERVLDVNVKGLFFSVREEVRAMIDTGGGSIVNLTSVAGLKGIPQASAYSASKHAVVGLTRSVAIEVARRGIRVNALSPGLVNTPMADRLADKAGTDKQSLAVASPMQRLISREEVARAALWLFSDATVSVTGQVLSIDGGLSVS